MSKKKFVPMKVQFRQEEHKRALSDAEAKLKLINEGLKWCEKHVDIESIDRKGFLVDMEKEFEKQFLKQKGDIVKQSIAIDKLYFLLDVSIGELQEIQRQADRLRVKVYVKDEDYISAVVEEDYWMYTKNEEENEMLIKANNLISALDMISKYRKVYPYHICQGVSNFIGYDMRSGKYVLNLG